MTPATDPHLITYDEVLAYITEHFAGVDVASAMGATFFSLAPIG